MAKLTPAVSPNEPDPALLEVLDSIKGICLLGVEAIVLVSASGWVVPAVGRMFQANGDLINPLAGLAAVAAALSFQLSEPQRSPRMRRMALVLAGVVTVSAVIIFIEHCLSSFGSFGPSIFRIHIPQHLPNDTLFLLTAPGFALLGIAMALMQNTRRIAARFADPIVFVLCFLVLVLASGELFSFLDVSPALPSTTTAPETMLCLLLLTGVAVLRLPVHSIFSIFLGRGIGGRIARFAAPVLLSIPFLRETARIRFIGQSTIPPSYISAILASFVAMVSFGLLLFIAKRITGMEIEIHDLSLRDELTGLHNLRGFHFLGDQALRMAKRSQVPFSVLFIDVDNLKHINDSFGHSAGSATLIDTGRLLKSTFRETDVLGRIGGDEFAVAGQFSTAAISVAILRLREAVALRNAEVHRDPVLSLSIGHVTSDLYGHESLAELLDLADRSMYEEKREKKVRSL